jgi:23S rRNA pseudouridine1911/1915/1917 synthase
MILAAKQQNYNAGPGEPAPIRLTLPADCAGLRLDQALANLLPEFSRNRITQWIRAGRVVVEGHAAQPKTRVYGGEVVAVTPAAEPSVLAAEPEAIALDILHEDAAVLVIAKPAGLVVHPGSGNWHGTMLNALLAHTPALAALPRAGIVHRLDKETSGLLVVGKTLQAQTHLTRQLQARTVKREYLALVHGAIERGGHVDAPVGRHPTQRTRMAVVERGRPAVTHYEVLERFGRHATLLRCRLETGRTHQIRVHLQSLNHPLVGDPVYGKSRRSALDVLNAFKRQALHAEKLAFQHPDTGETVAWQAPLPDDFAQLLGALRTDPGVSA